MDTKPLLVDAHQDLAWNVLTFGRDYSRPVAETRRRESGGLAPLHNGDTLLGWDAYQAGRVALIFATLFAAPERRKEGNWDTLVYANPLQAHDLYRAQVDVYQRMFEEHPDKFRLIASRPDLESHLRTWRRQAPEEPSAKPIGLLISMEGAEGVREVGELDEWWSRGVRAIGPAWAGTRFCGGSKEPGPLTREGYGLLDGMASLGFILDLSHMDEQAAMQALDHYPGPIIASHANAAALLKGYQGNRLLSDRLIEAALEREAVIGVVPYGKFLHPDWSKGGDRRMIPLSLVVEQIDYFCQFAGDARHVGIGSDFDGGFGVASTPQGIDTISDLQALVPLLAAKGYTEDEIAAIFGGNWLDLLEEALPEIV